MPKSKKNQNNYDKSFDGLKGYYNKKDKSHHKKNKLSKSKISDNEGEKNTNEEINTTLNLQSDEKQKFEEQKKTLQRKAKEMNQDTILNMTYYELVTAHVMRLQKAQNNVKLTKEEKFVISMVLDSAVYLMCTSEKSIMSDYHEQAIEGVCKEIYISAIFAKVLDECYKIIKKNNNLNINEDFVQHILFDLPYDNNTTELNRDTSQEKKDNYDNNDNINNNDDTFTQEELVAICHDNIIDQHQQEGAVNEGNDEQDLNNIFLHNNNINSIESQNNITSDDNNNIVVSGTSSTIINGFNHDSVMEM